MKMDMTRPATAKELAEIADSPIYRQWTVADYSHWVVRINTRDQGLPGRTVVWLKRHQDEMRATNLHRMERDEFYDEILPNIEMAIVSLGWPLVRVNHEWLGNEIEEHRGHGHYHVTPRYSAPIELCGRSFVDEDCNARRRTPKLKLEEIELLRIRDFLRTPLGFSG